MKKRIHIILTLCLIFLSLNACVKKDEEVVIKTFPTGEKKETAILREKGRKKLRIKSFEYYKTGEKKREYNHKDNLYFGPWTYWYKDGSVIAEGIFDQKTSRPGKAVGSALYYWPNGEKMLFLKVEEIDGDSNITEYYDESGNSYTDDTISEDLKEKIREVITDWTKGDIWRSPTVFAGYFSSFVDLSKTEVFPFHSTATPSVTWKPYEQAETG